MKKSFRYKKSILISEWLHYKNFWFDIKRYIKKAFKGLYFLLSRIGRFLLFLSRHLEYIISPIFMLLIILYFIINTAVINDYMKTHHRWYVEILCKTNAEDKLKKSVVRIVGGESEGSGFFISDNEVMTNFHVIDGEPSPKIIFPNGQFITPVKITGNREADLAILKTENSYPEYKLPLPTEMDFKDDMPLISAGYPLGTIINGPPTIVRGKYLDYRTSRKEQVGYIQTDFSLVEGMSGGPLTDVCGKVMGINTISMSGQSLFIGGGIAKFLLSTFTDQEIAKIEVDPKLSPEEAVKGFYIYLKARRMQDGYDLLSESYRKYATKEEWTNRFNDIINVDVVSVSRYNNSKDTVYIKFVTKNWIDGEVEYHFYQGAWKTVKEGDIYKLSHSNIEEITEPDWDWYYE